MGDVKVVDKFDFFSGHPHVLNKGAMRALLFINKTFESVWTADISMWKLNNGIF